MSPTAVTCSKVGDATGVLPIVLFTLTTLTWLKRLKPSSIRSSRRAPPKRNARDSRMSNDEVPQICERSEKHGILALLRPTPAGRSFTVVSLLLSAPVTIVKGAADAYEKTAPIWKPASARRTASLVP